MTELFTAPFVIVGRDGRQRQFAPVKFVFVVRVDFRIDLRQQHVGKRTAVVSPELLSDILDAGDHIRDIVGGYRRYGQRIVDELAESGFLVTLFKRAFNGRV